MTDGQEAGGGADDHDREGDRDGGGAEMVVGLVEGP
jgi:hypothetical protein